MIHGFLEHHHLATESAIGENKLMATAFEEALSPKRCCPSAGAEKPAEGGLLC